ncbi:class I SAM-dependent methyltransferase [bacterium]|nr:MAG: class I SAM-dependent methyltransferase [bacterium]
MIARYFPHLDREDLVLEPSCGPGRFLAALPATVPAVGVEIDTALAAEARVRTGRRIIEGDFRTVHLDVQPTAVVGNPPFDLDVIDGFLARCHRLLPDGGRLGFILPAYIFQTASRVCRYAESWSIDQSLIPRNIFPGLSMPLLFALFSKDRRRTLVGFALYHETRDAKNLAERYRALLEDAPKGGVWWAVVRAALMDLGGTGTVDQIARAIEGRRPTTTAWWREKVRQVLQARCVRSAPATYSLPATA